MNVFEKAWEAAKTSGPVSEPTTPAVSVSTHEPINDVSEGTSSGDEVVKDSAAEQASVSAEVEVSEGDSPAISEQGDIEELTITDDKGKRVVKFDFSDREKVKKAVQLALGSRKWQAERDQARKELTSIKPEYEKLKQDFSKLDDAFQKGGVKALVGLLSGNDEKAWDRIVEAEIKRREYIANLTPAERMQMEKEEELKREREEKSEIAKKYEQKLKELELKEEQAQLKSLESRVHPTFDKYRFTGKLNDAVAEHELDNALWTRAMARLAEYPEGVELTSALIDKEFRAVAATFNKVIGKQAEKQVKKSIDNKKADALKTAQVTAKKGMASSSNVDKFKKDIKSGDLTSALKSLFTGSVKL